MPDNALPRPRTDGVLPGAVRLQRVYKDVLNRPLTGSVVLTGTDKTVDGHTTIVAAPVPVKLVNGVLDVFLPADTYILTATLKTEEGHSIKEREEIVLTA